jgi:3-dehydroquinate synthase
MVISTGGRFLLDPRNLLALAPTSVFLCLAAEPVEILGRLSETVPIRPLLQGADPAGRVAALLDERAAGYGQFPQIITGGKTPESVVGEVLQVAAQLVETGEWQMMDSRIPVTYPGGRYEVVVGQGLLPRLRDLAGLDGPVVIVTDRNVGPLYAEQLIGVDADKVITVPAGEQYKRLETVQKLYDQFLEAGLERKGTVMALGGGVVGDMAGFAAATYLRGVAFVQCPTSLLAMVDASVGGKTGVDLPQGKNLVGAFKQPEIVLASLDTLTTLPPEEFAAGMAEVIKSGLIGAPALFERLEKGEGAVVRESAVHTLQSLVVETILVKQEVVEADPFESGRRALLNLGHTFGHAIEQVSGYRVSHGYGVAMGLMAAARLSAVLGNCDPALERRIEQVLLKHHLPVRIPADLPTASMVQAMGRDKKKTAGQIRFILLRDVGDVFIGKDVPESAVGEVLEGLKEG